MNPATAKWHLDSPDHPTRVLPRTTCAASTCREAVSPGRIFCPNHWFFLPRWMRAAITTTFFDFEWDAHQEAVRRAADEIDHHELAAREAGFDGIQSMPDGHGGHRGFYVRVVQ